MATKLTEDLALMLGLLFRSLAPMRKRDNMRAVAEGIEAMGSEEAAYWLGMAIHRKKPAARADGLTVSAHGAPDKEEPVVKLTYVGIKNFRAIDRLDLEPDPVLTVFHGDNAHGKTSILDAIAVGLGRILTRLPDVSGIGFRKTDRRESRPMWVV